MNKFCEMTFNKKIKEDILVDLVSNILKNLYRRGYFFFLEDVLISEKEYHFIFGGKIRFAKALNKEIAEYIKIKNYKGPKF